MYNIYKLVNIHVYTYRYSVFLLIKKPKNINQSTKKALNINKCFIMKCIFSVDNKCCFMSESFLIISSNTCTDPSQSYWNTPTLLRL